MSYFGNLCSLIFVSLMMFAVHRSTADCPSHQFQCGNGRCIPITWHCDEDNDCGDETDENSCEMRTCSETELKCRNAKCVPIRWICDNEDDCGDKTDEEPQHCQNKTCGPDQFSCGAGLCIPVTWRCDGQEDCADGSDEKVDCHQITCTEEEFTCQNNKCITKRWVCDQDNDCGDFSDERNCPNVTCSRSEFMCSNGKCIPDRWRCDGDVDCLDGSDEHRCPEQSPREPRCGAGEFACATRDCVHSDWRCDGEADCPDGSDELNCTTTCRSDQFRCSDRKCVAGMRQCDGKADCADGSDEKDCPASDRKECSSPEEFECGGAPLRCISQDLVCNGKNDCGGWEDEPKDKCFVNECSVNNGGCSQKCVDDAVGFHCDCFGGYAPLDNRTCEDVNECDVHGSCSQLCENTKGSFKCSCLEGYSIEPSNHRRCKAQQGHAALLFSNRRDLRRIHLETSEYAQVASGLRSAVAVDYDYARGIVVWTDVLEGKVYSAPLRTGAPVSEVVSRAFTPDGVAVDWLHGHLYWTDTGEDSVNVVTLDGLTRKTLFRRDLDEPRALVLNPAEGWMFWADWGVPKIERAGMDGTHRSVIVSEGVQWPNGLTIDLVSRSIFWADAKLHLLAACDFDGSRRRVVLASASDVKHPFALDVFEDWLYWTDWATESILRADKFTGKDVQTVANGISSPMGLKVYHAYKQPKGSNACGPKNGGCSHLCLPAPHFSEGSAKYTCACPNPMVLSDNGLNCLDLDSPATKSSVPTQASSTRFHRPPTRLTHPPTRLTHPPTTKSTASPRTSAYSTESTKNIMKQSTSSEGYFSSVPTIQPTQQQQSVFMMNETLREIQEVIDDSGRIAGISIGVLAGLCLILAIVGFCVYKQYLRRNITSMNFDNPVYRKTTEDRVQFTELSLEKNQYQPSASYPSSLEPLTSPGTNEFV